MSEKFHRNDSHENCHLLGKVENFEVQLFILLQTVKRERAHEVWKNHYIKNSKAEKKWLLKFFKLETEK